MVTVEARRVPSLFITSIMLVLVGLFLGIALLNSQRELTVLCLFVLGMAGGLKLWTEASSFRVRCGQTLDKTRLFAGEKLVLSVLAENGKPLPVWLEVSVPTDGFSAKAGSDQAIRGEGSLSWFQRTQFQWEMTATRRGVYQIGPIKVLSGDLFGFFQKETERSEQHEVIVYPRLVPLAPFPLQRRDFFGIPGGKSPVNDPAYILGTTDYHHGRPAKHIHWKASARHNKLQEKVFEPTQQEKVFLVVDVRQFAQSHEYEAFERTLEVVASLTALLDRQGCGVGLLANGAVRGGSPFIAITRSLRQVAAVLETLARLETEPAARVVDMLSVVDIPWGTSCVYFTFKEDEETAVARECLERRNIPVLFLTAETVSNVRRNGHRDVEAGTEAVNVSEEEWNSGNEARV
jgi:uncharacterized protein (DUF58 family)